MIRFYSRRISWWGFSALRVASGTAKKVEGGKEAQFLPALTMADMGAQPQRRCARRVTFAEVASAASAMRPAVICRLFFSIFFRCPRPALPVFFIGPPPGESSKPAGPSYASSTRRLSIAPFKSFQINSEES